MVSDTRHKVVVIGSGFGGIAAAKKLKHADVDVTLISKTTYHLFQPLLYQVATGILSEGEIAPTNRDLLQKQKNVRVLLGEVTDINLANKYVVSELGGKKTQHPFDSLIVATGAALSYFGNDQFGEFAPGLKTVDDALELRARIMGAFERAEASEDPHERKKYLTFVIVGAGPTGVELTRQIAEMSFRILKKSYDVIDPKDIKVILMDAAPSVLPTFGATSGKRAEKDLTNIGVEVLLNAMVTNVDENSLTYKDKSGNEHVITSFCKIWSAGVAANPLGKLIADQAGAKTDRAGRVIVEPDLSLPGYPNVFVVGDLMNVPGVPGMVQGALQGARYAAVAIEESLAGKDPKDRKPFSYFNKGMMAYVCRFKSVAQINKIEIGGVFAWFAWLAVHLYYLTGVKNRIFAFLDWIITLPTKHRSELVSTEQQIYARNSINKLKAEHELPQA